MIWLVRHAPVAVEGVCYGQSDVALSIGHDEAAAVIVRRLDERKRATDPYVAPTRVVASPWERTAGLARRVADTLKLPLEIDERLSELSFGLWEGMTYKSLETRDRARFERWMAGYLTARPPGGETLDELMARVANFVAERRVDLPLVVTHAGVVRAMRSMASGRPYADELERKVEHLQPELLASCHPLPFSRERSGAQGVEEARPV